MNFVLTRTEQILGDSAVPPPPQPVSSSLGANASGRPVRQAARIRRSDMVIDEGESDGNTDSTYQNEEECTQEYKSRADFIGNVVDDSATVGMDDADANIIQGPVDTVQSVYAPENMFTGDDGKGGKGKERAEVCVLLFIHKFFIKVSKRLGICSLRMT